MSERSSGWYPDPDDESQLRYFDGILWTDRRMPKVKPGLADTASRIGSTDTSATEAGSSERRGTPEAGAAQDQKERPARRATPWGGLRPDDRQGNRDSDAGNPFEHRPGAGPVDRGTPPDTDRQAGLNAGTPRPTTTDDGVALSSWWRRLLAYVIDWILVLIVSTAIASPWMGTWYATFTDYLDRSMAAAEAGRGQPSQPESLTQLPPAWLLSMALVYAVYEITFVTWRGRTIGKMCTGISIRPWAEHRRPNLNESCIRFLVKGIGVLTAPVPQLAGVFGLFQLLDGFWPLMDRQRQSLHDKPVRTVVVLGSVPAAQPEPTSEGDQQ
ncbi:RDD family protein [Dermacoccaceae bacterium W4C1]